jgi:heat shock protein HslJ
VRRRPNRPRRARRGSAAAPNSARVASLSALAAAVTAAALLAGCGSEVAASTEPNGTVQSPDLSGQWQLTSGELSGTPFDLSRGRAVTLSVADGEVSGTSACNQYVGVATIDGSSIRFRQLGGTEMACEPDVMNLEQTYLQALGTVSSADRRGDSLIFEGPAVRLVFGPVTPVQDRPLVGTLWTLDALSHGEVVSSVAVAAPLQLSPDGTVVGSTGCTDFSGSYVVTGGILKITRATLGTAPCGPVVEQQMTAVASALGDPLTVTIKGTTLTLVRPNGDGLTYRAEGPAA